MLKPLIKPGYIDYFLEAFSTTILVSLIFINTLWYGNLSEFISEESFLYSLVSSSADNISIWLIPILGIGFFIGFSFLTRIPQKFNYPVRVNPQNAEQIYRKGILVIRIVKLLFLLMLFYINLRIIG